MENFVEMNAREEKVLKYVVKEYIETKHPVSSRKIGKHYMKYSSATIRNIMADLEEKEYLYQPHPSAGRVPTVKGIKYYVNNLFDKRELDEEEKIKAFSAISSINSEEMGDLVRTTLRALSEITLQPSIATFPKMQENIIREVAFLKLSEKKILVILVLEPTIIKKHIAYLSSPVSQEMLIRIKNYLLKLIGGVTVKEGRKKLREKIEQEKNAFDAFLKTALGMGFEIMELCTDEVYYEGLSKIFESPFISGEQIGKKILHMFEQKLVLYKILDHLLEEKTSVSVIFGDDLNTEELKGTGVVASTYKTQRGGSGVVGVVGPVYMNYPKILPAVDLIARIITNTMKNKENAVYRMEH